eukprot:gene18500-biopygen3944
MPAPRPRHPKPTIATVRATPAPRPRQCPVPPAPAQRSATVAAGGSSTWRVLTPADTHTVSPAPPFSTKARGGGLRAPARHSSRREGGRSCINRANCKGCLQPILAIPQDLSVC